MSIRFLLRAANGQEYPITGPFRIGRESECQIQIDNNLISRIHASIWTDHDHLLLRDERSRNGTQLNGQPLVPGEAHYLHHDDEVRVGDTILIVVSDPPYPRQHGGLAGQLEDEPPVTAQVDKPGPAPAPPPPAAAASAPVRRAAPSANPAPLFAGGLNPLAGPNVFAPDRMVAPPSPAPPRRSRAVSLAIGGCLALVLLSVCCALGLFAATTVGPAVLTALAPTARRSATPAAPAAAAYAADTARPPTPQPAAEPVASNHELAAALGARPCLTSACRPARLQHSLKNARPYR
jgi:predicted component of type VI protein secretion system